jgi:hypothetical protein
LAREREEFDVTISPKENEETGAVVLQETSGFDAGDCLRASLREEAAKTGTGTAIGSGLEVGLYGGGGCEAGKEPSTQQSSHGQFGARAETSGTMGGRKGSLRPSNFSVAEV